MFDSSPGFIPQVVRLGQGIALPLRRLEEGTALPLLPTVSVGKVAKCQGRSSMIFISRDSDVSMSTYPSIKPNLVPDLFEQLTGNHVLLNFVRALEDTGNSCVTVHPFER